MLAAAETLVSARSAWSGTCIFLFQPAEELGVGAQAMVDDGLYDESKHACPIPDIVLGQHVLPLPAACVGTRAGTFMSAADSFKITIFGSGGHGSMPHRCIDPVVIASHIVVRLQTIASREVPPNETAVVTVGALQAGSAENVISDEAVLKVNIRTVSAEWRDRILASVLADRKDYPGAAQQMRDYLKFAGAAKDADEVRGQLQQIEKMMTDLSATAQPGEQAPKEQ